jgi:hypothetical protein
MKPGEIIIKDSGILHGLLTHKFDSILADIICYIADQKGVVITESYRDQEHKNDLHGTYPVRAIDLRTWCYDDAMAYRIMEDVNALWLYDPARPLKKVAIIHKTETGAMHMHVQVHPNTEVAT